MLVTVLLQLPLVRNSQNTLMTLSCAVKDAALNMLATVLPQVAKLRLTLGLHVVI